VNQDEVNQRISRLKGASTINSAALAQQAKLEESVKNNRITDATVREPANLVYEEPVKQKQEEPAVEKMTKADVDVSGLKMSVGPHMVTAFRAWWRTLVNESEDLRNIRPWVQPRQEDFDRWLETEHAKWPSPMARLVEDGGTMQAIKDANPPMQIDRSRPSATERRGNDYGTSATRTFGR
jgi:hypothetical protein